MKLYTEKQVKKAISIAEYGDYECEQIIDELTPIELPSDEEIDKQLPNNLEGNYVSGFYDGVEWVINHIKQQDNG